jgi:hypothetical protein
MAELGTALALVVAGGTSFAAAVGTFTVTNGAMGLSFSACGLVLARYRPRNPIGWLFLAAGVLEATSACALQCFEVGVREGWHPGALRLLGSVGLYSWPWAIGLLLPTALLLFPDGKPGPGDGGGWSGPPLAKACCSSSASLIPPRNSSGNTA